MRSWPHNPTTHCQCDDCYIARRIAVKKARRTTDDRFKRPVDEHSAWAFNRGRCRCDICRDMANEYRRNLKKQRDQ